MMSHRVYCSSIIIIIGSVCALSAALVSQYIFGLHPCPLCIYQRIPYAALIGLGLAYGWKQWAWLLWVSIAALIIESTIAFYHMGIEYHWWQGVTSCSVIGGNAQTIEDLRAQIMAAPAVRCDEPAFEFILSMAGWNMVYALTMLAGLIFFGLVRKKE